MRIIFTYFHTTKNIPSTGWDLPIEKLFASTLTIGYLRGKFEIWQVRCDALMGKMLSYVDVLQKQKVWQAIHTESNFAKKSMPDFKLRGLGFKQVLARLQWFFHASIGRSLCGRDVSLFNTYSTKPFHVGSCPKYTGHSWSTVTGWVLPLPSQSISQQFELSFL